MGRESPGFKTNMEEGRRQEETKQDENGKLRIMGIMAEDGHVRILDALCYGHQPRAEMQEFLCGP
jgi:hypothetical protein